MVSLSVWLFRERLIADQAGSRSGVRWICRLCPDCDLPGSQNHAPFPKLGQPQLGPRQSKTKAIKKQDNQKPRPWETRTGFLGAGQCAVENGTPATKANRAGRSRKTKIQPNTDMNLTGKRPRGARHVARAAGGDPDHITSSRIGENVAIIKWRRRCASFS